MDKQNFVVYWQHNIGKTYIYGSKINYVTKDYVVFENNLFPAGSCLHSWTSLGNYQGQRSAVQLPLLEKGCEYNIYLNVSSMPNNTLYIELAFYDYYDKIINIVIVKMTSGTFTYPDDAYYYKISLINAGLQKIIFHNLVIENHLQDSENQLCKRNGLLMSNILNESSDSQCLQVLFTEPVVGKVAYVQEKLIKQFSDVIHVTSNRLYAQFYMSNQYEEAILSTIEHLHTRYEISNINFIGYGPISSNAAMYYSSKFDYSNAYVTSDYGRLKSTRDMIYTDGYQKFNQNTSNFDKSFTKIYYQVPALESTLKCVDMILDKSLRLQKYIDFVNN